MSAKMCQDVILLLVFCYTDTMRTYKKRFILFTSITLCSFILLSTSLLFLSPEQNIGFFPSLSIVSVLLFITLTGVFTIIFKNIRRGILLSLFILSYLYLRLMHLDNTFFILTLVFVFILFDLVLKQKHN